MARMQDHERVQIQMGELRRLQQCDREVKDLRKRNQILEDTLRRAVTLNRESLSVIEAAGINNVKEGG